MDKSKNEARDTGMAYLLWCSCFLGVCGLHRFYSGKYATGIIWVFTAGLLGVGQFFDLFFIPGMVEEKNLKTLKKRLDSGDIFDYLPQERVERVVEKTPPKSDTQIILELGKKHPEGISLADCVIATNKTVEEIKELLKNLYKQGLVEMENHPETGAVIYKVF
ncbi:MAG: NINE protein [Okeania sp. SIO3I5]|uniref:NINE protein n=1 Tax=Okeania sp. SIO3I5 TaxID=2607805 RepID=UPI0013B6699A|nr:NINE protein [Okeania sp. SIO3I5]NEQ37639.1 NINE protein [Okeania sp. SIO3I5]